MRLHTWMSYRCAKWGHCSVIKGDGIINSYFRLRSLKVSTVSLWASSRYVHSVCIIYIGVFAEEFRSFKLCCIYIVRVDYIPHPLEKHHVHQGEKYRPPEGEMETMTNYAKEYTSKCMHRDACVRYSLYFPPKSAAHRVIIGHCKD